MGVIMGDIMFSWGREKNARANESARNTQSPASVSVASTIVSHEPESDSPAITSLEEALVEAGAISRDQLDCALATQSKSGGFLGQILVDMGLFNENSFTSFLAKQCRIPHLSLLDYLIDTEMLTLVSKEICCKYRLLPIDKMGRNLTVAMVNPLDSEALAAVRAACPDLRIKPILCAFQHYEAVSKKLFETDGVKNNQEVSLESYGFKRNPDVPPAVIHGENLEDSFFAIPSEEEFPPENDLSLPAAAASSSVVDSDFLVDKVFVAHARALAEESESSEVIDAIMSKQADIADVLKPAEVPLPEISSPSDIMRDMISVMQDSMCDTYAMLARRMELFRGLKPGDVAKLFAKGVTTEYSTGDAIFKKGQSGREMFVILGGKVEVRDGDRVLATLAKGDMFGEMAFISQEPRSASVVALEPTSVLALSNEIIHQLLSKDAAIQILENIVMKLCVRLRAANQR